MLTINHLSAGYGGDAVIKDLSLTLKSGQSLCILGPNGCGKTTLLRAMAALIPCEGEILLDGRDVHRMKRRELAGQIAVMSQLSSVYYSYSVYDMVMLGRYQHVRHSLFGTIGTKDRDAVERCLAATGLTQLRDQPIDPLSGGQLQRAFLAKALAQEPRLILLDEPTNHLDMKCQMELLDYLKGWIASGEHAVIGVFHDINLALHLSDQLLFIKDGTIAGRGRFAEVATPAFLESVYDMDVAGYMIKSYQKWMNHVEGSHVHQSL